MFEHIVRDDRQKCEMARLISWRGTTGSEARERQENENERKESSSVDRVYCGKSGEVCVN